jgi:hypothetical protein
MFYAHLELIDWLLWMLEGYSNVECSPVYTASNTRQQITHPCFLSLIFPLAFSLSLSLSLARPPSPPPPKNPDTFRCISLSFYKYIMYTSIKAVLLIIIKICIYFLISLFKRKREPTAILAAAATLEKKSSCVKKKQSILFLSSFLFLFVFVCFCFFF